MLFCCYYCCRTVHMASDVYWRQPFAAAATGRQLTEYVVLDVESTYGGQHQGQNGRWTAAEVQVARKSDFGRNETTFFARTHIGHLLHPGVLVRGCVGSALRACCY